MKTTIKISIVMAAIAIAIFSCKKKEEPKPEPKAPVITIGTQPAATITVTEGSITESLTVAATVTQGATLTYQWYSNATASNVGGTAVATGGASATFAIPTTLTANTYYYFCEVSATGADAKRSNAATVTVTAAPPDGTEGNPFIVNDETTLKKVGSGTDGWELSSYYRQTANITLTGNWTPIGNSTTRFTGTYDGGGYSITNLAIPSAIADHEGMFGYIGNVGVVKNVTLINVSISATGAYRGGIAGRNDGTIVPAHYTAYI